MYKISYTNRHPVARGSHRGSQACVLAPASHVVDSAVAAYADGVVHDADGVSNDHGDCKPVSVGITISMLPPTWIVPVGVNDSVAVSLTPGVSVPVSNDLAPVKDPAAI